MSVQYKAVQWNPQKKRYDRVLAAGVALYVGAFVGMGAVLQPNATAETLLIRAFGTGALLLLHITLCIGPLCRLDPRFLPLLYNRRHLGVTTFLLGLSHGGFAIAQFHALGDLHPLVSVLASNPRFDSVSQFPFQPFGLAALTFLFLMAATSHDFWLANLTAPVWKALHMGVYLAYASLVIHVSFGALHSETHPALPAILAVGFMSVLGLHLAAGWRERAGDAERLPQGEDGYVDVCAVDAIREARAHVVALAGERIAVFRYDGCVVGNLECLPAPERTARRGKSGRRLRRVSLARLPVSARQRALSRALHGEDPDLPRSRPRRSRVGRPEPQPPRHAGRARADRGGVPWQLSGATSST